MRKARCARIKKLDFFFYQGIIIVCLQDNCRMLFLLLLQVNEKFNKLERGYRDCIKGQETRQGMMHQALDDSDETRKYGISDPCYNPYITT